MGGGDDRLSMAVQSHTILLWCCVTAVHETPCRPLVDRQRVSLLVREHPKSKAFRNLGLHPQLRIQRTSQPRPQVP